MSKKQKMFIHIPFSSTVVTVAPIFLNFNHFIRSGSLLEHSPSSVRINAVNEFTAFKSPHTVHTYIRIKTNSKYRWMGGWLKWTLAKLCSSELENICVNMLKIGKPNASQTNMATINMYCK